MRLHSILLFLGILLFASCNRVSYDPQLNSALKELDRVLEKEEALTAAKLSRIDSIRSKLAFTEEPMERYRIYDALAEEFIKWDPDSALLYAHQKERLAHEMNDSFLINDAILTISRRYMISGMYHEALSLVQDLDRKVVEESGQVQECEYILYRIYHGLVSSTLDEAITRQYREKEREYLNSCKALLKKNSLEYYTTRASDLVEGGVRKYDEAREMMEKLLENPDLSIEDQSYYRYWLARAYQAGGDDRSAMLNYAISARLDYLTPQREYSSAIRLAKLCYYQGDLDRAYRYITRSYNDTQKAKARLRMNQLSPLLPLIIQDYEKQSKSNLTNIYLFIGLLLVILAALAATLALVFRSRRRLRKANREITRKTRALEDSNQIKDAYITEFLQMFSEHVGSLDRYRNELKKSTEKKDINALIKQLNSDKFIDAEWDYLFLKFDQTFLGIFPDFVEKLNTLLRKDSYQVGANLYPGRLNNELRTYALIRLGVTDSTRIAKFLHLSVSTVYNNRVRLRNAARNREHFEELVMKL